MSDSLGDHIGNTDRIKLRADYAWKWFQMHAVQRTTMFNYFLIITGVLATAYIGLLKEGYGFLAALLGILGCVTSLGFYCLDCRNRELVRFGEDALRQLEREYLFNEGAPLAETAMILVRDAREEEDRSPFGAVFLKHKTWIRAIEIVVGVLFVALTVVALRPAPKASREEELSVQLTALTAQTQDVRQRQEELLRELNRVRTLSEQTRNTNLQLQKQLGHAVARIQHGQVRRSKR
jgi:hypothetical protein